METWTFSIEGGLETVQFAINYENYSGSYFNDLLVGICAPNGNCVEFGGYNVSLGYESAGGMGALASDDVWQYIGTVDVEGTELAGTGEWTVTFLNAYCPTPECSNPSAA